MPYELSTDPAYGTVRPLVGLLGTRMRRREPAAVQILPRPALSQQAVSSGEAAAAANGLNDGSEPATLDVIRMLPSGPRNHISQRTGGLVVHSGSTLGA